MRPEANDIFRSVVPSAADMRITGAVVEFHRARLDPDMHAHAAVRAHSRADARSLAQAMRRRVESTGAIVVSCLMLCC